MYKTSKTIRKMCVLAGIAALGVTANALSLDAHISIDRALNSPTVTIRYTGAHTALVELRVNGESLGTRSVTSTKDSGETNFTVNLSDLKDGDNEVEVRLFDRTGKLVGSDKSNISTDQSNRGPVYLSSPKVGATLVGPVEIKLSFDHEMKNAYASFFVDSNFKSMSNYPPYSYIWDTTRETNGWHEVEAWAIDESSTTFKTKKTRVFIHNPGGRTERTGVSADVALSKPKITANVTGIESGTKPVSVSGSHASATAAISTTPNKINAAPAGGADGLKPAPTSAAISTGAKVLNPTGLRNAKPGAATVNPGVISIKLHPTTVAMGGTQGLPKGVVGEVNAAAHMIAITKGQRIPNVGAFAIELNSQFVKFDVQPRVDNGVPMTPFRYLLEKDGGKVKWENMTKTVTANADGKSITIQIGDRNAKVDKITMSMEVTPYIDRGRTIVPLSFIHDALGVNVEYDKETGHVLITNATK